MARSRSSAALVKTEPVVVFGAGGLGLICISIIKAMKGKGAIAVDIDPVKRDAAKRQGALATIDPNAPDALAQIQTAAKGPVWAAIDFVGNAQTARLGVDSLVKGGKLIVVGLFGGDITLSLPFIPIRAMTIQGSYTGSLQELNELLELVRAKGLPPIPLTTRPLDQSGRRARRSARRQSGRPRGAYAGLIRRRQQKGVRQWMPTNCAPCRRRSRIVTRASRSPPSSRSKPKARSTTAISPARWRPAARFAVAGLHPATGGSGLELCSGDMLLEALVACAGVTIKAVATALDIPLKSGKVSAEGDLDFRGTLGVAKDAPVGFAQIRLRFDLDTDAGQDKLDQLLKLTERYCVVYQTIKSGPPVDVKLARV